MGNKMQGGKKKKKESGKEKIPQRKMQCPVDKKHNFFSSNIYITVL
jgi:hypothetical protein